MLVGTGLLEVEEAVVARALPENEIYVKSEIRIGF